MDSPSSISAPRSPRKGVDVLLEAYFDAFDDRSDVSLVLKTFPNPHNEVAQLLARLRAGHAHPPDVRWIDRDFDDEQLQGLYRLADCYVHPARGEGFGLPVAEAMAAGSRSSAWHTPDWPTSSGMTPRSPFPSPSNRRAATSASPTPCGPSPTESVGRGDGVVGG